MILGLCTTARVPCAAAVRIYHFPDSGPHAAARDFCAAARELLTGVCRGMDKLCRGMRAICWFPITISLELLRVLMLFLARKYP